jgi:hypothetical protein
MFERCIENEFVLVANNVNGIPWQFFFPPVLYLVSLKGNLKLFQGESVEL